MRARAAACRDPVSRSSRALSRVTSRSSVGLVQRQACSRATCSSSQQVAGGGEARVAAQRHAAGRDEISHLGGAAEQPQVRGRAPDDAGTGGRAGAAAAPRRARAHAPAACCARRQPSAASRSNSARASASTPSAAWMIHGCAGRGARARGAHALRTVDVQASATSRNRRSTRVGNSVLLQQRIERVVVRDGRDAAEEVLEAAGEQALRARHGGARPHGRLVDAGAR